MEGLAFYLTFFIVGSPEVWHGNVDAMMDTSIKFVKEKACASDGYIWKWIRNCRFKNRQRTDYSTKYCLHSIRKGLILIILITWSQAFIKRKIYDSLKYKPELQRKRVNLMDKGWDLKRQNCCVFLRLYQWWLLLESSEMPYLTEQGALVKTTIVALLLVLNFKYFCSGITIY